MTKYIQGKDGKFAGSIGDGKTSLPTASDLPRTAAASAPDSASGTEDVSRTWAAFQDTYTNLLKEKATAAGNFYGTGPTASAAMSDARIGHLRNGDAKVAFEVELLNTDAETVAREFSDLGIPHTVASGYGTSRPNPNAWIIGQTPTGVELVGPIESPVEALHDAKNIEAAIADGIPDAVPQFTCIAKKHDEISIPDDADEMTRKYGPVGALAYNSYWGEYYTIKSHNPDGSVTVQWHGSSMKPYWNNRETTHQTPLEEGKDRIISLPPQ